MVYTGVTPAAGVALKGCEHAAVDQRQTRLSMTSGSPGRHAARHDTALAQRGASVRTRALGRIALLIAVVATDGAALLMSSGGVFHSLT